MIYFDNAATTFPKPEIVYKTMDEFYRSYGVNVGRGQHKLASKASSVVSETRKLLLELFHADSKQVVLSHSATESLNIILQGLINTNGLNVFISPFEHNAVTRVLYAIKSKCDINIVEMPVDKTTLNYDLEKLRQEFYLNKPHYVIVSHASNVCGLIAPIKEICELAKRFNAVNIIDMSQTAGLVDTDLSSDIYDFAVFAGHKTLYGPLGIGGFICSGDIKPKPTLFGGTGVNSAEQGILSSIPDMYEVGSPNIMAIAGLNAALKWIREKGIDNISKKEQNRHMCLLNILNKYSNIEIVGTGKVENSIGVVSALFDGYSSQDIGLILSENNIAVRTGLHCSPSAHKFLETFPAGTIRFSVSYYNKDTDFEKLAETLEYIEVNS